MISTKAQARDEMLAVHQTAWDAGAPSLGLPVLYWDTEGDIPDAGGWCRITVRHAEGSQVTLSSSVGTRRFRHRGTVTVQIFTPHNEGGTLSDSLTDIVENAYEGTTTSPGRVIFTNVRTQEIGQEGQWFQTNVLADFEYDKIR